MSQLQNSIRLAASKKDKICVVENKIVVLLVRGNMKSVVDLMTNVQSNLPNKDLNYINAVLEFISIFNQEIDERFENAESLMGTVLSVESSLQNYQPLNKYIGEWGFTLK